MADLDIPKERLALEEAIEKLVRSSVLRSSESLCSLLRYLARQAMDAPAAAPKEYQIAVEAFGRAPDFDSRLDSTVRVQTGRLRSKLAEYYAGPGSEDDLIIAIPKGSYCLTMSRRPAPEPVAPPAVPEAPEAPEVRPAAPEPPGKRAERRWYLLVGASVLLAAMAYWGWGLHARSNARPAAATRTFWHAFLSRTQPTLVVFSNAEFIGAPTKATGMRYFDPSTDSPRDIRDQYTGTGEVFAVHALDRLIAGLGGELLLKRGRQLAWEEAKGANLIFLGSTIENLSLRELPEPRDFVFQWREDPPREGAWEIRNLRPGPGEKQSYPGVVGLPATEDHGLIALLPGLETNRWVLILAGTTTVGTQAAAEFVCRPEALEDLVGRLHISDPARPVPFEAVIKVQISGGVPVQTEIVALHVRSRSHT